MLILLGGLVACGHTHYVTSTSTWYSSRFISIIGASSLSPDRTYGRTVTAAALHVVYNYTQLF